MDCQHYFPIFSVTRPQRWFVQIIMKCSAIQLQFMLIPQYQSPIMDCQLFFSWIFSQPFLRNGLEDHHEIEYIYFLQYNCNLF